MSNVRDVSRLGWNSFQNISILAGVVFERPYSFQCAVNNMKCPYPGVGIDLELFDYICKLIGLSYKLVAPQDGLWGYRMKNGNWTGMLGMIIRGEVIMSADSITYTAERADYMYMTVSIYNEPRGWAVLTQNQNSLSFLAAKPFSLQVWFACFVAFLIATTMAAIIQLSFTKENNNKTVISDLFWKFYGETLQQASNARCERAAPSILLIFYRFYIISIVSAYCASLITSLMVTEDFVPFRTLDELASLIQNGQYKFLTETPSELEELNKHENFRSALESNPPEIAENEEESVSMLIHSPGLVYTGTMRYLSSNVRPHCNVTILYLPDFPNQQNAFGFHKNDLGLRLKNEFNRQLPIVMGMLDTTSQRYISRTGCSNPEMDMAPISITQIQSVVFIFLCGYPAAICLLIYETIITRYYGPIRR